MLDDDGKFRMDDRRDKVSDSALFSPDVECEAKREASRVRRSSASEENMPSRKCSACREYCTAEWVFCNRMST